MSTEQSRQTAYLNVLRCFAILCVIGLHAITPYIINTEYYGTKSWFIFLLANSIFRAGVPIFLMISGYLHLSNRTTFNFGLFYKKSLRRILIPLLVWNIVYYCYYGIIDGNPLSLQIFFEQLINSGSAYHMWYLYTLFGIYLLAPFIKRIVDNCTISQLIWFEILACFCGTLRPLFNTFLPFNIYLFEPLFNGYLSFFILGYILGKVNLNKRWILAIVFGGVCGIALSVLGNHFFSSSTRINLFFNYGYSICHYLIAIAIFVLIYKLLKDRDESRFSRAANKFSKLVFGIYLIHVIVIELITKYFMIKANPIFCAIYLTVLTTFISTFLIWLLQKVKFLKTIL